MWDQDLDGYWVVFMGDTPYSHNASLHPGKSMGARERSRNLDELMEDNLYWPSSRCRRSNNASIYYIQMKARYSLAEKSKWAHNTSTNHHILRQYNQTIRAII